MKQRGSIIIAAAMVGIGLLAGAVILWSGRSKERLGDTFPVLSLWSTTSTQANAIFSKAKDIYDPNNTATFTKVYAKNLASGLCVQSGEGGSLLNAAGACGGGSGNTSTLSGTSVSPFGYVFYSDDAHSATTSANFSYSATKGFILAGTATATNAAITGVAGIVKCSATAPCSVAISNTDYAAAAHASRHYSGGADPIVSYTIGSVTSNAAIAAATKTKITYNEWGQVTSGADATTSDISEGTNLYYTDARGRASASAFVQDGTATTAKFTTVTSTNAAITGIAGIVKCSATTLCSAASSGTDYDTAAAWNTNANASTTAVFADKIQTLTNKTIAYASNTMTGVATSTHTHSTSDIGEGTNLYFTTARVDTQVTASSGITHIVCANGQVAKSDGSNWTCGTDNNSGVADSVSATGTAGQVAIFDAAHSVTSESDFTYVRTTGLSVQNTASAYSAVISNSATLSWLVTGILKVTNGVIALATAGTDYLTQAANAILTGIWDFGGAASLEIPNAAQPLTGTTGQIAIDTTDDQLRYFGGSATRTITYKNHFGAGFTSSTNFVANDPGISNANLWPNSEDAITILNIRCNTDTGTSVVALAQSTSSTAITLAADGIDGSTTIICTPTGATDDGALSNATVPVGNSVYLNFGAVGDTTQPKKVTVLATYAVNTE